MGCCGQFGAVAIGVIKALVKAEEALSAKRMTFCRVCPERRKKKCKLCGCFIDLKTRVKSEACPAGKWGAVK
jgi:ribosomal protein S9